MDKVKSHWQYILFFTIFAIVVFLPPILHGNKLTINGDTAAHLSNFESIKSGNPHFMYLGEEVTGYTLMWINDTTGISLSTLFIWFNYLIIFLSGLSVASLIIITTKSWAGGFLSAILITFGLRATITLFRHGITYNIQSYLILLPIWITLVYCYMNGKKIKLFNKWIIAIIPVSLLILFWHPSLGLDGLKTITPIILTPIALASSSTPISEPTINPISTLYQIFGFANLALLFFYAVKIRGEMKPPIKVIGMILISTSIIMLILSAFPFTRFSVRMAINSCLLLGLFLCLYTGFALHNTKNKITVNVILFAITISAIPNLITWFTLKGIGISS